ncbi:MAG: BtaA family protein [Planctomycetia bacterium]|nr:BtaA family protein [Planctomycetia bacterium]
MSFSEWMSSKVFKYVHGRHLVYNTCWEDPRLDRVALELGPEDNVLVITSAGCNALDYILAGCKHVYAVDMNFRQNAVLDLKKSAIKNLNYEEFFQLFGHGYFPQFKSLYKSKLRQDLPEMSQRFWDKKYVYFSRKKRSYYMHGTSGQFARMINMYINKILRIRPVVNRMLNAETLEEQAKIYKEELQKRFWTRTMRFIMNRDTTLSMLGVPRAQRAQIESQYAEGLVRFVQDCLEAVLCELPLRDNYFWRVYITGSYTPECCPEYLKEENFEKLRGGLAEQVTTYTDSVEGFLRKNDLPISRFVLLDHMDWLASNLFPALVSEWEAILMRATDNARFIWRSGGLKTDFLERVELVFPGQAEKTKLVDHLKFYPEQAADLHKLDRVHTYGSFYIADLIK